jgi:hypothetical protein
MGRWMTGVRAFWQRHRLLDTLFDNGYILLLFASIMFNYLDVLQPYAAVPFVAFVVLYGLGEYVPLNKMPFSTTNAVLDGGNRFTGAMAVVTQLLFITLFFSLVMELFNPTDAESFVKRVVSVLAMAVPIVALSYILVASKPM